MPNALKQYAEARPTPRNKLMGLLANTLTQANEFATLMDPRYENKRQNQTLGLLADAVSLGSLAKTADRMSYGEPLTNAGKANVPFMKPETADALMMAPLSPRNALAALGMGMADNGAMRAATVWHGSPHKFDKFDASKIGTGEGAQAYGHGIYVAESSDVAKGYMDAGAAAGNLKNNRFFIDGVEVDVNAMSKGAKAAFANAKEGDAALRLAIEKTPGLASGSQWAKDFLDAARSFAGKKIETKPFEPNIYKVDLPDDAIARMLDWDKPLSQQAPGVLEAARKALPPRYINGRYVDPYNSQATGQALLDQLRMLADAGPAGMRTPEAALKAAGVPGIRYLDGGSRGAGQGSSNFVVFPGNEGLLSILERNGQPLK